MDMEYFSRLLRQQREKAGMSRDELAHKTGVTPRAIQYWESAEREISLTNAYKVLEALGILIMFKKVE